MPDCDTGVIHRYSAFISYSHMDAAFARRLHRRLEGYRLPRRLVSARVDARRRLKPIFRDRDELPAAPDLSAAVKAALADCQYLIVICSPHAEASAWVAREVSLFRELHGEHAVLAVLVEGCEEANFRTLLCDSRGDGHDIEPLAADFRRGGDGKSLAFLKLVSVLADVRLAALVQRDAQRRIRSIVMAGASGFAGLVALASLAVMAVEARAEIDRKNERIHNFIRHQRKEVRSKLTANGRIDILNMLDNGTADYYRSEDVSQLSVPDQEEYAKILQDIGQDDEAGGDLDDANKQFLEAYNLTSRLLTQDKTDRSLIFAQAQSEYWVGENAWRTRHYDIAERSFKTYLELANQLVHSAPNDPVGLGEQAYAQSNLGTFYLRSKIDLDRAEAYYLASLLAFRAVQAVRPGDTEIAMNIAEMYGWLGDVKRLRGDCEAASNYRGLAHQILTELQQREPSNAIKYALVAEELALARIDLCRRAPQAALAKLEKGRADAEALSENDPKNIDRHRQVRIFALFQVSIWLSLLPDTRPNDKVIANALGNCAAESLLRNNNEIAQFCYILQARRFGLLGNSSDAEKSLKEAQALSPTGADGLSPRWGLNFHEEERPVTFIPAYKGK